MLVYFRTLGAVELRKGDTDLSALLAHPKRIALLAWLAAARPRGFHGRDALLALFWPGSDTERGRNSLRQALHHLRRAIGDEALPGRGDRELGVNPAMIRCDAVLFDEAIESGRLEEALSLYRGEFLPGLAVQDAPEVERWIADERARRRREAVDAARRLADAAVRTGEHEAAARFLARAATLDGTARPEPAEHPAAEIPLAPTPAVTAPTAAGAGAGPATPHPWAVDETTGPLPDESHRPPTLRSGLVVAIMVALVLLAAWLLLGIVRH